MTGMAAGVSFPGFAPTPGRPAYFDPDHGAWQVFGYRQVQRVLSDHTVFSSYRGGLDPQDTADTGSASLTDLDPPRHRQLRSLMSSAFTARSVAQLEEWTEALAEELLAPFLDRGELDVVGDFAHHLPLRVIGRLAGFPTADLEQLREWGHASGNVRSPGAAEAQRLMGDYFGALIADRRAHPGDDVLSRMIAAEIDGSGCPSRSWSRPARCC